MSVINPTPTRLRFRRSGAVWIAAVLTVVFVMPFAGSVFVELDGATRVLLSPVAVVTVLIPAAVAVWSLRSGVDVTTEGLTVKALLGSRHYPWDDIRGFDAEGSTVYALLPAARLPLPAVREVDLPTLLAAGGEHLVDEDDQ